MEKFVKQFPRIIQKAHKIEFIMMFMDELEKIYGFSHISFFPLTENLIHTFCKNLSREKQKCLSSVNYTDKITNYTRKITGISRPNQFCKTIAFESLYEPESSKNTHKWLPQDIYGSRENLLDGKTKSEKSLVYLSGNKISILMRSADNVNQFILQAHLPPSLTSNAKRLLSWPDLMLFKVVTHLLWMSLQKFVIIALSNTVQTGMKGSTEIVPMTHKQDSLKKLCKFLQQSL